MRSARRLFELSAEARRTPLERLRNVWARVSPGPFETFFFLLACILIVALISRTGDVRLYWEYGGMLDGGVYTPGYTDWVHHRIGGYPEPATVAHPGLAPYSQFGCEYPPGVLLIFAWLRKFASSFSDFSIAYSTLACAFAAALIFLAFRVRVLQEQTPRRQVWAILLPAWVYFAGGFFVSRFDIIPTALVAFAFIFATRQQKLLAGTLLGLGAAIKLWPALLVLPFAMYVARDADEKSADRHSADQAAADSHADVVSWRSGLLLVGAAAIAFLVPHVIIVLSYGTAYFDVFGYLTFLRERPAQIESMPASVGILATLGFGGRPVTNFDYGSHNAVFGPYFRLAFSALSLIGYGVALWAWRYRLRRNTPPSERPAVMIDDNRAMDLLGVGGAVVVIAMVTAPVFSGEYLIWLMPFVFLRGRIREAVLYFAALLCLKPVYENYDQVTAATLGGTLLVAVKNLLVVALGISFATSLLGSPAAGARSFAGGAVNPDRGRRD
jgi:hypothetical protein